MNPGTYADRHEWRRAFQTTTAVAIASALQRIEPDAGWTLEPTDVNAAGSYYDAALNAVASATSVRCKSRYFR